MFATVNAGSGWSCRLTDYQRPVLLDTLAAAYAAAGEFDKALEIAEKAIELANLTDKKEIALEIRDRIELYKSVERILNG